MIAGWPRGKVLKLTVGETGFEGKGQRFRFRQAHGREFCWEDGTVQRVEKIQKTLFQVRWTCCVPLFSMAVLGCSSCSSSQVAEKHWHCPAHKAIEAGEEFEPHWREASHDHHVIIEDGQKYNCHLDSTTWRTSWSKSKQTWCCMSHPEFAVPCASGQAVRGGQCIEV
eukprot:s2696_g2.t1